MSAVIANHCVSALTREEAKRAEATMNDLVGSCESMPHDAASFRVVLLPGGGMEFASAGDGGSDEVPICVVSHKLQHRVHLTAPCPIDVRLEQTTMSAPVAVDAGR
jgi:hypothetical protein